MPFLWQYKTLRKWSTNFIWLFRLMPLLTIHCWVFFTAPLSLPASPAVSPSSLGRLSSYIMGNTSDDCIKYRFSVKMCSQRRPRILVFLIKDLWIEIPFWLFTHTSIALSCVETVILCYGCCCCSLFFPYSLHVANVGVHPQKYRLFSLFNPTLQARFNQMTWQATEHLHGYFQIIQDYPAYKCPVG